MTGKALEFNFKRKNKRKVKPSRLAGRLYAYLHVAREWRTRADVKRDIGLTSRECRLARAASNGRVIQSVRGYRLTKYATDEELRACLNNFKAQADALMNEYRKVNRRRHAQINNGKES